MQPVVQPVEEKIEPEVIAETKPTENVMPVVEEKETAVYKNVVASLSNLEKGKYYVQIATLAEEENINTLLNTYGKKYPIVLVPLKSGKAYQIMVGPLTIDEYGTVLSRFKSYGYKDAFLRKIR